MRVPHSWYYGDIKKCKWYCTYLKRLWLLQSKVVVVKQHRRASTDTVWLWICSSAVISLVITTWTLRRTRADWRLKEASAEKIKNKVTERLLKMKILWARVRVWEYNSSSNTETVYPPFLLSILRNTVIWKWYNQTISAWINVRYSLISLYCG